MNTYHYTYLITNLQPTADQKYYIGVRSCRCTPEEDEYFGSSKYLSIDYNLNPAHFEKIIIEQWPSRNKADAHEEWLHDYYDVKDNKLFYNKCNSTANGFRGGALSKELELQRAQKIKDHYANMTDADRARMTKQRSNSGKKKKWTAKAVQNRLDNCLKSATARVGTRWTDDHRHNRLNYYIKKNIDIAMPIIRLAETGLNNRQIALQLNVSWDKVKYTLQHKEDFISSF